MKTKILIFCLCLLVAVCLFGCGTRSESPKNDYTQSLTETVESDGSLTDIAVSTSSAEDTKAHSETLTQAEAPPLTESFDKAAEDTAKTVSQYTQSEGTGYNEPQINFSDLE
ncbi:MAG: hypothetical protein IJF19_01220 [Clostridia bacterium]|nr:hypothetical protein [Clostridia bacterium]